MSDEPESLVLQLLRAMRAEMATKTDLADVRSDLADVRSEIHSLRADVAADFIDMHRDLAGGREELGEQIVGLRRAVVEYIRRPLGMAS